MPATRKSKKRDAIRDALLSTKSHPTAEWIYHHLKGEISDLSLGTVYRNLSLFKEEGEAVCVATVDGQDRFDGCVKPHAHFICRQCGAVTDLEEIEIPPFPDPQAQVDACQLNYYGICRDCDKQNQ